MNKLTTFAYLDNSVRVVEIDGQPWFVATDLYRVLYGRTTGLTHWTKVLAADQRRVLRKNDERVFNSLSSLFAACAHSVSVVSESGLYKLVMRSDKPAARKFQDWVTRDVLPAIRKAEAQRLLFGASGAFTTHLRSIGINTTRLWSAGNQCDVPEKHHHERCTAPDQYPFS